MTRQFSKVDGRSISKTESGYNGSSSFLFAHLFICYTKSARQLNKYTVPRLNTD